MTTRKERLRKLVVVQEQLKSLHEQRRAGFLAGANAARTEAEALAESAQAEGSFSTLFPDLYQKRISAALAREQASLDKARLEASKVATATLRTNMVDKAYRDVARKDERDSADRERLDRVGGSDRAGPKAPEDGK